MSRRTLIGALVSILSSYLGLVMAAGASLGSIPLRWRLLIAAFAFALGAGRTHRRREISLNRLMLPLALSTVFLGLAWSLDPSKSSNFVLLQRLSLLTSSWGMLLCLGTPHLFSHSWFKRAWIQLLQCARHRFFPIVLGALVIIFVFAIQQGIRGSYATVIDEVLYLSQAHAFSNGSVSHPLSVEDWPLVAMRQSFFTEAGWITQYPPGWPIVLSISQLIASPRFANPIMAGLSVTLAVLVGRRIGGIRVGMAAGGLLLVNDWFLFHGATYYAHASTLFFLLLGTWALIQPRWSLGWECLAIGTLSFAMTIRPLSALSIAASLLIWRCLVDGRRTRFLRVGILSLVLAAIALMSYNHATTGNWLQFGYGAAHQGLHDLGFGERGFVTYDQDGGARKETLDYTPLRALQQGLRMLVEATGAFLPFFFSVPLIWWTRGLCTRRARSLLMAFCLLPLCFSLYFFAHIRFLMDLTPWVCLASGWLLFAPQRPRRAIPSALPARSLFCILLLMGGLNSWQRLSADHHIFDQRFRPLFEQIEEATASGQDLLVLVQDEQNPPSTFEALSFFNRKGFQAPTRVVRDRGPLNSRLFERYPNAQVLSLRFPRNHSNPALSPPQSSR